MPTHYDDYADNQSTWLPKEPLHSPIDASIGDLPMKERRAPGFAVDLLVPALERVGVYGSHPGRVAGIPTQFRLGWDRRAPPTNWGHTANSALDDDWTLMASLGITPEGGQYQYAGLGYDTLARALVEADRRYRSMVTGAPSDALARPRVAH